MRLLTLAFLTIVSQAKAPQSETARCEAGTELLKRVAAVYSSATTIHARYEIARVGAGLELVESGTALLARPDKARIETAVPKAELRIWDGVRSWRIERDSGNYWRENQSFSGLPFLGDNPLGFFYLQDELTRHPVAELVGAEKIGDVEYQIVEATISQGRAKLYVGPDLLIHRIVGKRGQMQVTGLIDSVQLNVTPSPDDLTFHPAAGSVEITKPGTDRLLSVGTTAPNVAIKMLDGRTVSVRELLKGRKALLIHFWAPG